MNDFKFLLPDGSYRTADQERFSAAYRTGAVPVEATPIVELVAPDGLIVSLHHSEAAPLIRERGYKLFTSPRPLRFSSPDGRTGEVKLGYESDAFRRGGDLILKELSTDKPLAVDLPRDPKIAAEPPDSPLGNWFGPVPKDPASLKGWNAYQALVAKNKKGKAGFWEGVAPTAYNIPFVGVGKEAVDVGKAVLTANRIRDGKAVSDQDVLDLNLYLTEMDRQSKASIGGKVGKVFVDMLTFMAEIGVSTGATVLAGAGLAGGAEAVGGKLTVKAARKALNEWAQKKVQKAAWKIAVDKAGADATEYLSKWHMRAGMKALTALPEIGLTTVAPTVFQVGAQAIMTSAAGQEVGTRRGNQDRLFAALNGEEMDSTAALWRGIGDTAIENWSESMGELLSSGFKKVTGLGAIGAAIGKNINTWVMAAGKTGVEGAQLAAKAKGIAAIGTWVGKKMAEGQPFPVVMKRLQDYGYHGVIGEMLEERAGDFLRGLTGLQGQPDDNALVRAITEAIPSPEQAKVELLAFSMPMALLGGAHLAANARTIDQWFRDAETMDAALRMNKNYQPFKDGKFNSQHEEKLLPGYKRMMERYRLWDQEQGPVATGMNKLLELAQFRYIKGEGLVSNPDIRYSETMSVQVAEVGNRERARVIEDWKKANPNEASVPSDVLKQADDAGARFAIRHTAGLNSFVLLYRDSEPGERERKAHVEGWQAANPGKEVPQSVKDEAQEIFDKFSKPGEGGITTMERAEKLGFDKRTLAIWSAAGMLKLDEKSGQIYLRDPSTTNVDENEAIADAMIMLGNDENAKKLLTDKARPKGIADVGGTYFQQVKDTAAAIELAKAMTPAAAAKLELEQNVFLDNGRKLGEQEKERKEYNLLLGDRQAYAELLAKVRERDPNALHATWSDFMEIKKGRSRAWVRSDDLSAPQPGSLEDLFVRYADNKITDLAELSRARFLLFGGTDQAQVDTDLSTLRGWLQLRRDGKLLVHNDVVKRNGDKDEASYRVVGARRDVKTGKKHFSLQRYELGMAVGAPIAVDQDEVAKNYGKPARLAVQFTPYSYVEGSFEEIRDHLHATNYFGTKLAQLRAENTGMTVEQLLKEKIDHRDVMMTGVVQARKNEKGERVFRMTSSALSDNGLLMFNPRRMAGSEGYPVAEDSLEVLLREVATDKEWRRTPEALKAAFPQTYAAFVAAVDEATANLKAAEKNARGFGAATKARRDLAQLRLLPDLQHGEAAGLIEFFSKYFARYDNGFINADTINQRPQTEGFKVLLANSTAISKADKAIKSELDAAIPKDIRSAFDYKRKAEAQKESGTATAEPAKPGVAKPGEAAKPETVPVSAERGKPAINTPSAEVESISGYAPPVVDKKGKQVRPAAARLKLKNGTVVFTEDKATVERARAAFEKKGAKPVAGVKPAAGAKPAAKPVAKPAAPPSVASFGFTKREPTKAEAAEFDAAIDAWAGGEDLSVRQAAMLFAWSDDDTGIITPDSLRRDGYNRHPDGHWSKTAAPKPAARVASPAEEVAEDEEAEPAPAVGEEEPEGEAAPAPAEEVVEEGEVPPPVSAEMDEDEVPDTSGEDVEPPEDSSDPEQVKQSWLDAFNLDEEEDAKPGASVDLAPEIPIFDTGLPPAVLANTEANKALLDAAFDKAFNGPLQVRVGGRPNRVKPSGKTTRVGKFVLSEAELEGALRHLASMDPRTAAQLDSFFGAIVQLSAAMGEKTLPREKALELVADRSRGRLTPNDLVNLFRASLATSGGLQALQKAREAIPAEDDFEDAPETDDDSTVRQERKEELAGEETGDPAAEEPTDSEVGTPEEGVSSESPDSYMAMKLKDAKMLQDLRLRLPALTVLESMLGIDVTAWALANFQEKHGFGEDGSLPAFAETPEAFAAAKVEAARKGRFAALAQSPLAYAYQAIEMDLLSKASYEDMLDTLKLVRGLVPVQDILMNSDPFGAPKASSDPSLQPLTRVLRAGARDITAANDAFLAKFSELMAPWRVKHGWKAVPGYKSFFADAGWQTRLQDLNRLLTHVMLSNVRNNMKLALGEKGMLAALMRWDRSSSIRATPSQWLSRLMEAHDALEAGEKAKAARLLRQFVRSEAKVDRLRGQTLGTHLEKKHLRRMRGKVGRGSQTFFFSSSPLLTWAIRAKRTGQLRRMRGIRDSRGNLIPFTRVSADQFRRYYRELVRESFDAYRAKRDVGIPIFLVPATKIATLAAVSVPISELFKGAGVPASFDAFYSALMAEDGPWNRESRRIWTEAYADPVEAAKGKDDLKQFLKRSDLLTTTLVPLTYDIPGGVKTELGKDGVRYVRIAVIDGDLGDGNALAPANRVKELEVSARADRSGNEKPGGSLKVQALHFDGKGGAFIGKTAVHSAEALGQLAYVDGESSAPPMKELVAVADALGSAHGALFVLGKTSAKWVYGIEGEAVAPIKGYNAKIYLIPANSVGVSAALRQDTAGTANQVISNQVTTTEAYAFREQYPAWIEATYAANAEDKLKILGKGGWTPAAQKKVVDDLRETNSGVAEFIEANGIRAAQGNPLVWQHVVNGLVRAYASRAGAWRTGRTGTGNVAANVPTAPEASDKSKAPSNGARIVRLEDGRRAVAPDGGFLLAAPEVANGEFHPGHAAYAITEREKKINLDHRDRYVEPVLALMRAAFVPEEWARPLLRSLDTFRESTQRDLTFADKTLPFHSEQEARQFLAWLQFHGMVLDLAQADPATGAPRIEEGRAGGHWSEFTGEFVAPYALIPVSPDGKRVVGVRIAGTASLDMRIPHEGPASGTITIRSFNTGNATHLSHAAQDALSGGDGDGDLLHLRSFDPHDVASWKPFGLFRSMLASAAAKGWDPAGTGIGPGTFLDAMESYAAEREGRVAAAEARLPHTFEASMSRIVNAQLAETMGLAIIGSSGSAHLAASLVPYAMAIHGKAELRRTWHGDREMISGRPAPKQRKEGELSMRPERDRLASGLNNTILDYANNLERAGKLGLEPWQLPMLYYSIHSLEVPEFENASGLSGEELDKARMAHVANHTVAAVLNFLERTWIGREWSAAMRASWSNLRGEEHVAGLSKARTAKEREKAWSVHVGRKVAVAVARLDKQIRDAKKAGDESAAKELDAKRVAAKASADEAMDTIRFLYGVDGQSREAFGYMFLRRIVDKVEIRSYADLLETRALVAKFKYGAAAPEFGLGDASWLQSRPDGYQSDPLVAETLKLAGSIADELSVNGFPPNLDPVERVDAAIVAAANKLRKSGKSDLSAGEQALLDSVDGSDNVESTALLIDRRRALEQALNNLYSIGAAMRLRGHDAGDFKALHESVRARVDAALEEGPLADNALLVSLDLAEGETGKVEDGTKKALLSATVEDSPKAAVERHAAWDALPFDLQLDLFELFVREHGIMPGVQGTIVEWLSPAFLQKMQPHLAESRESIKGLLTADVLLRNAASKTRTKGSLIEMLLGPDAGYESIYGGRGIKDVVIKMPHMAILEKRLSDAIDAGADVSIVKRGEFHYAKVGEEPEVRVSEGAARRLVQRAKDALKAKPKPAAKAEAASVSAAPFSIRPGVPLKERAKMNGTALNGERLAGVVVMPQAPAGSSSAGYLAHAKAQKLATTEAELLAAAKPGALFIVSVPSAVRGVGVLDGEDLVAPYSVIPELIHRGATVRTDTEANANSNFNKDAEGQVFSLLRYLEEQGEAVGTDAPANTFREWRAAAAPAAQPAPATPEAAPAEQPKRLESYDAADLFVAIQEAGLSQRALDASFRIMPGEAIPTESPDAARLAALARIDADEDLDQDTKDELKTAVEVVQLEAWGESADAADRLELFKYEARRKLVYADGVDRALRVAHFKKLGMDKANETVDALKDAFLSRDLDVRQLAWSDLAQVSKEFKVLRSPAERDYAKTLRDLLPALRAVEKTTLRDYEKPGELFGASADFAGMGNPLGIGWYDPSMDSVVLRRYADEMEWHQDHSELLGSPPPNGADGFRVYAKGGMFNRIGTVMWTGQPGSQESVHAVETAAAREFRELRRAEFVHKTMGGAPVAFAEAPGASIDAAGLPPPAESPNRFLLRAGDPESDLSRPEGNKTSVALPALSEEETKLSVPAETVDALREQLGVSNVQVFSGEHPYFKDAPAVVDARNGVVFLRDPAALPRALASYVLAVVGENAPMLAANVAPDIAQALTTTERSNHADDALSSLLEAEIARRLSGAASLFEDQGHWLPVLADDLADRIENGLRPLLAEAKLVRKGNKLVVAPTDSIRQLAPADRGFAPNDSVPWDKAAASKVVPESLRPRLARAIGPHSAAIEIMGAADRGEIDDVAEDVLLRSAFESLPTAKFPGGIEDPQLRMGMSVDSIYFHDYGSRAALLKRMGIPAMHMAYFEAMNAIHASEINGGSWQETVRMLLDHDSQWLHRIVTDKDGYRHQDRASKVALSKYERQLLMRLEYAVTALMEHADQFDLDNPAVLKQLFEQETIVYGRFQPRFVSGKDRPQGELPEFDKIGNVLREFEASGLKAKMLDPAVGGRTADELDVVKLAKDARARYDEAVLDLNDLTADFLNGGVFMDFRSRFAPHFYGWAPALDPEGSEADRAVARLLKYADPAKSLLKKGDGSIDDSGKDKHQGTVPDWTQVQQDLLQGLDPKAYARGKAMETVAPDGKRSGGPNVVQANRMLSNALRKRLYDSAAKHMASSPNPGEWVPSAEDQANLATLKHILDVMRRYRFVESSPAEFPRSHDTFVSAYVGDGTLARPDRDLRPRTMSFIDLHREYMDRVYAAAAHKAVLNAYLGFTDVDGRPLVMAQPSANIDFEHGAVKRETWERYAANVANYYGDKFDPQGDLAKQLRDLYSKHASKNSTEVIVSPKMPSIQQWSVVGKNAARLLKNIVGLSPTYTYALARGAISAAAWTKTMSFGWSAFFYTSLAESSVSFSGVWDRNLMKQLFSDPKALKSFWSDVKAFREHRRYYRPAIAQKIKYLVDMGMTSSGPAASEQYIGQFQRDMASLAHWMAEKYGKQNADRFMWLMFGDKNETGWKKFWPGLTGSKMSQWMFDWFSAIKEAQTDMYVKQLAASEGYDTGHLVSWNQARFLVNDSNNVMGGQNWARYLKWTPTVRFLANVFFLAPNWTLSAWNASGLGFLTQALFGTYMDPGQARRTWMDYNPAMVLWVMLLTPAAIQALMFSIGKAFGGDPDDVPLPLMNEPGRKQYVDITPLVRLFPNYKGGLTGKRRAYIQFAKQVHETGLSNPFGDRGWINEPLNQAMRKLSQPVKLVYEQMTGLSPGSDWQLEFQGKGMLGWITSGEPGAKGFMTSRTGYIVQKFIPMSWSQFIQNPETFPFNHLAPTSKGASQSKIVQNVASVLATYASAKDWHRIRQVPRARAALDGLVPEFLRAAEANGYNPEKVLATAKGMVLGDLYARMWQALDTNDEALMKATAASIWRVGGALKGLRSSLANKQKSFGIELTPEQLQQAEDAMNWAMYGNE